MNYSRFVAVALLLVLPWVGLLAAQQPSDTLVYNAMFAHFFGRFRATSVPTPVWVEDSTFAERDVSRYPRRSEDVYGGYPVDTALIARLKQVTLAKDSVGVLYLPASVRIATRGVKDSLPYLQRDLTPRVLAGNHFAPSGVFGLGRIAYDADGSHALMLYSWRYCGARCAEINIAYFVRPPGGVWQFVRNFGVWSS